MIKFGLIGVGNMGTALLRGYADSNSSKGVGLYAYDIDPSKAETIKPFGATFLSDETEIVKTCDYILIAAKPQQAGELLDKIKPFASTKVIISICAGISIVYMEKKLGGSAKIIQVMPNTPMMLSLGASALARNANVSDDEFLFVKRILESSGIAEELPPDKMNEIICINGSSPAFIYKLAECFVEYAVREGIDEEAALRLFSQSLIGAGTMLKDSGMSPGELIAQVTSKGGTTLAGLTELEKGLSDNVMRTCEACTKRAYELGEMV